MAMVKPKAKHRLIDDNNVENNSINKTKKSKPSNHGVQGEILVNKLSKAKLKKVSSNKKLLNLLKSLELKGSNL